MTAAPTLHFCTDPGQFLADAETYLAADPVVGTVVASVTRRMAARRAEGVALPEDVWWLVVRDASGAVVGVAMRTAPFPPRPPFLLPMPRKAAVALAEAWHRRGERVRAVNGALPAARACADEVARLDGGRVAVAQHTRLHLLDHLTPPAPVPGALRAATTDDIDLVAAWFGAFTADADEQAGRPRGAGAHETPGRAEMLHRIRDGRVWFWTDESGAPVHLTAANPPSFGVARVGPVYTPPGQRGRGWAGNAVAEVSRRLTAEGARVCLFTDQANPVSNRLYARLGFRPVVDMVNLVLVD
ncbi:GNAT family N-acetyltransferase [Micromonospora sp. BRA006-A]|uniref:GNAT family N-acetyltransferase n=1 Tax=Micromonospora sp. BRA006-A TaxID=2962860 RepID=UPI00296FB873|nr:GNAT family N-acetyltransferase [Micromonospora sp. BRA006-A]MDW3848259.1 GNAT family N-acetyltransferase [Micromonospora sp. BRA006-A]